MKHKKNLIILVIPILLIILIPYKASARTIGTPISQVSWSHIMVQGEYTYDYRIKYNGTNYDAWSGVGEGNIIFSLLTNNVDQAISPVDQIQAIYIYTTSGNQFICDIGNNVSYIDNGTQRVLYTANCPVTLEQNEAWRYIKIQRSDNYGKLKIGFSTHATFITKEGNVSVNVNQQQVVQAISDSQTATINAINNSTTQAHNDSLDLQGILDDMGQMDLEESDKVQPNQDEYDNVENKEEIVYDNLDDLDIDNLIDITIDSDTSTWIWNLITSILNVNARVRRLFLTILSLGLCKFILGR